MSRLLQTLIERSILSEEGAQALEKEISSSAETEEEAILRKKILTEKSLFEIKSEITGFPLKTVDIEEVLLKALEFIPEESAKYYKMVPLKIEGNTLEVGMVFPEDLKAQEVLDFLARQNRFSYKIYLINFTNFYEIIKQYGTLKGEFSKALESLEGELNEEKKAKVAAPSDSRPLVEDAPVIKMVAVILKYAVDGEASDIHIEPMKDKSRVRYRIDGKLHASIFLPNKTHPSIVARIKILSNLKIDETRVPQDGRFSTTVYNKEIDFRVSTFPTSLGEKVVIRVLIPGDQAATLEDLGFEGRNLELVKGAIEKPYGLILSTGPTGSGKTTTLYTLLDMLNKEGVNIVTLEDPIEYFMKGINHSQIRPDIGYGFAEGLRSILRQDPDIIMVGEVRDEETSSLVMHAALTGHIVLSTLHTNNAVGVIPRLIDMGIPPFLIPSSLTVMIAQRLVGALCPHCKKKKENISQDIINIFEKELLSIPEETKKELDFSFGELYDAVGCKKCNWRGYKGRIGLFEVFEMTEELSALTISSNLSEELLIAEARRQGMITIRQDGLIKALKGKTSVEEILRAGEEM